MTASGRHRGRTGADATLVASLAGGATTATCAQSAGVSERTVRRRLEDPDFMARVDSARAEMLRSATAQISAGATMAVSALIELLESSIPPSVRLGSAKAMLEYGIRLRAELEIDLRLRAIEGPLNLTGIE